MTWEAVIGLEAHVQLSTKTKLFSRASTSFGADPNTNVNLVDCGLPGVLPTVNREAFYKAIRFGLAIDATINQTSHFDRKTIFTLICQKDIKFHNILHLFVLEEKWLYK
jgi:aspartyl-tRNA(Asn)/glutamyl-tRNA(Gln) amidotransferase subunit B